MTGMEQLMKVIRSIKTMFENAGEIVKLETIQACFINGKEYITFQFEGIPEIKIDLKSCIALCKDECKKSITKDEIDLLIEEYKKQDKDKIEKTNIPDSVKRKLLLDLETKEKKKALKQRAIEILTYVKSFDLAGKKLKTFMKKISDSVINEYREFLK